MSAAAQMWNDIGKMRHAYFLELRGYRRQALDLVYRKWDGKCAFCLKQTSRRTVTFDHICPKSRGGSDEAYNLRPLCRPCHEDLNRYSQCVGALMLARMIEARA